MRKLFLPGLITTVLLLLLLNLPVMAQGITNLSNLVLEGDLTAGDDVTMTDDLTVGDDAAITDDLTTTDLFVRQQTSQTIGYAGTITPTGTYHQINSATARGTSSIAGVGTAGRVVVIVNVGTGAITLTDTGTLKLSGNLALGTSDSVELISDGTNWIQLATSNN